MLSRELRHWLLLREYKLAPCVLSPAQTQQMTTIVNAMAQPGAGPVSRTARHFRLDFVGDSGDATSNRSKSSANSAISADSRKDEAELALTLRSIWVK